MIEAGGTSVQKRPIDIDAMISKVREAVRPFAKAALFQLSEEGFHSPFEQLVACIISIRTYDETTLVCARELFKLACTPEAMLALTPAQIERAIHRASFRETKARQIRDVARRVIEEGSEQRLCDFNLLTSFHGVGPKCANLVLAIACGIPSIAVDIHVHRVTNRWGYVAERTPERTLHDLQEKLPKRYWADINRLLVPFGKHICTGVRPHCSICPVLDMCRQTGVTSHR